ncbi:MAG: OmpA family protein [Desulfobacterales bacterium]|nr:OmpA family protein [Desulfobacterales bacterium]
MRRRSWIGLCAGLFVMAAAPAPASDLIQVSTPGLPSAISVERLAGPQQAVLSVRDPNGEPIVGLGPRSFALGHGIRKARVLSAEPIQADQALPVNLVLVIDNSFSMQERGAIPPLLAGLDDLLKDVRPIDNIHAVVFSERGMSVAGRSLNVRTFTSSRASEWSRFFAEAFDKGITRRTFLYEAVAAGLEIVKTMPADEQKLMMVFSDGEDLNSKIGAAAVAAGLPDLKKFWAFAIDYMPGEKTDAFLSSFAASHGGRIWKARSAAELSPIFRSFKTAVRHNYLLTYELLNPVALEPKRLSFERLTTSTGRPAAAMVFFHTHRDQLPEAYALLGSPAAADAFRPDDLKGALERYFNVLNIIGKTLREAPGSRIGIIGCTSDTGPEKNNLALAQGRAEAVKTYLERIWGIAPERMRVEARGLPADPSPSDTRAGRLENQRVEFIFSSEAARARVLGGLIAEAENQRALSVRLDLHPLPGIAGFEVTLRGEERVLHTLAAAAGPQPAYSIPLDAIGRERLASLNAIEAVLRVTDASGRVHEAASDLCHLKTASRELIHEIGHPPYGTIRLEPSPLTVEEITVVESSPLLHHVYFEAGRADIPERYHRFTSAAAASGFDEKTLQGTMDKYRHVLDIIGKRAAERPRARITLTGCHSDSGEEKGDLRLSRRRAESVSAYLKTVWGIDSSRLQIEARGLPAAASTPGSAEGRAENQRVEIAADDPAVLDTVQSTRLEAASDTDRVRIIPAVEEGLRLKRWRIAIYGDGNRLEALDGEGDLEPSYVLALKDVGLLNLGRHQTITAELEGEDAAGRRLQVQDRAEVRLVRREELRARREGYRVIEKYALILFDFNRADIKERNRVLVDRIGARLGQQPAAVVKIVGHTDHIGGGDYNLALSARRAKAVFDLLAAGGASAQGRISHEGKGSADPLYDNRLPEGRAYNRTVSVTLEYGQKP